MTLTLTILGCASSGGVPRVGGSGPEAGWGACDPTNPKNRRQRCSVLLTLAGQNGNPGGVTYCVIDTGPDFRAQMLQHSVPRLDGVVYTHEHADHLHGLDDLRPFALVQRQRIDVHMNDTTFARAQNGFGYVFETPEGSSYPPILKRHVIENHQPFTVDGPGGTVRIMPVPVVHGEMISLGLRIRDTLYLPDVSAIPANQMHHFEGLDCLIIDALRYKPHASHFNVEQALALHAEVKPKRTVLTNLHNDLDYAALLAETPEDVEPAYDGLQIDIHQA